MKRVAPTRSRTSDVLDALRSAIISGELVPGSLHSMHTLADQLGVSRTPVREALIQLAAQNMVRFERSRGIRILQTTIHDLEEIFALRLLLEVPATVRAATQLSEAALAELEQHYDGMHRAAARHDEARLMERDRRFHRTILQASGNSRLADYVDGLRDLVLVRGASTAGKSRTLADIADEHREILDLVREGDGHGAAAAMRAHIRHTAELLIAQESGHEVDRRISLDLDWTDFGVATVDVPGPDGRPRVTADHER